METIRGKMSLYLNFVELQARLNHYNRILLDLGTGDGRYVLALANKHPDWFVVGLDACRENLRTHSRAKLPNMLFIIASAQELPCEFKGLFSHVAINFPWGSLLKSLLTCDPDLMGGLSGVTRPDAQIEIRLNAGALMEAGTDLDTGAETIFHHLTQHGWILKPPYRMDHDDMTRVPTTWAKRLAYGRDPRAISLTGRRA